ncbi:carbohydrate ABC transporter substrate-binding protein, CUT1 family [Paramicrobacterium humi]|uniref:Carbohydrate ABC transporter substrate-binding protein, CUT1 family n=1 Tax=Paramicrobacterium humi TaxID=640635 RepID=A0A1H4JCK9_9MICO|nr:extracellular solute-binding protein [Microbacterium humi]SEB44109.1 carbohydrate ABC transporter substrate-binding protein, CUT1 family [Microbacterium humi]
MTPLRPHARSGPPLSRRHLLAGTAALLGGAFAAPALAGCSSTAAASGITDISYWHLLSGGDGITMATLVADVEKKLGDVSVKQTVLAWGAPYYTKLAMASAGGRAPDLAIMHASRVTGWAPGGLLDPWDLDLLAEFDVTEDTFKPRIWEKGFTDGRLYSVALDSHPFITFFNTDIADKAGVLTSDGTLIETSTPDEFVDMALEMQAVTGQHGLSWGYLNDGAQLWRLFYTLYRQHGADMVLETGKPAEYDEDAALESLKFMTRLVDGKIAAKNGDINNGIAEFAGQKSGMLFSGVWELRTMQDAGIPFDATIIPTLYGTPAVYADSHTFVLPHQSNPDETKRRAAYEFMATLLKGSIDWAGAGHIPAYLPVIEDPAYDELIPQAHYANAADLINYDPPAWFTGSGSDFQTYFLDAIQGVMLGSTTPEAGFTSFITRINTLLAKPNPVTA